MIQIAHFFLLIDTQFGKFFASFKIKLPQLAKDALMAGADLITT